MLACIINKLKSIILATLNLLSKILCCMKRRRRSSDAGIPVKAGSTSCDTLMNSMAEGAHWGEDDWEACEVVIDRGDPTRSPSPPRTTTDHISAYRQHMILAKQKSLEEAKEREEAAEQDLFSDMAPTIKRQKKIFIGERNGGGEQGSRLRAVEHDPLMSAGAELGTWEDGSSNTAGWQPEDDDLGEVLREQKRSRR